MSSKVVSSKVVSSEWGMVAYSAEISFRVASELLFRMLQMQVYSLFKAYEILSMSNARWRDDEW